MHNHQPVHEVRLGLIKATIWANATAHGTHYRVILTRLYKAGEQGQRAPSLRRQDLPLPAKVIDWTHVWLLTQTGSQTKH
jgi:hypothetical protein